MAVLEKLETSQEERDQTIRDVASKMRKLRYTETKLLKASATARAAIMLSPDVVDISAPNKDDTNGTVGLSVVGKAGTVIRGPLGLTTTPGEIRIAGMWTMNDMLLSAAPSTILTPIPVLRFSLPMADIQELITTTIAIGALAALV
jgi:hypothetical protein